MNDLALMEEYTSSQCMQGTCKSVLQWLYLQFSLYFMSLLGSLSPQHSFILILHWCCYLLLTLESYQTLRTCSLFIHVASISVTEMIVSLCCILALVLPGQLA